MGEDGGIESIVFELQRRKLLKVEKVLAGVTQFGQLENGKPEFKL